MECTICFERPQATIVCRGGCKVAVCVDCCRELVAFSKKEKILPQCPSRDCKRYYLQSQLISLGEQTLREYRRCCFSVLTSKEGDKVKKKIEYEQLIENLRKERLRFVRETFPEAIVLVAETALPNKLRRLEKQKLEVVAETVENAKRTCMNLFCDGHLDDDYRCMICDTHFCKDCEKRINGRHKCDPNDIASISFIRGVMHCPNCGLAIERSAGCNGMTCASCETKFDYASGEKGDHGSANTLIQARTKYRSSVVYESTLTKRELTLLVRIEDKQPGPASLVSINGTLKKYYQKKINRKECGQKLVKAFEVYTLRSEAQRRYHNYLNEIETLLEKGQLTLKYLKAVNKELI